MRNIVLLFVTELPDFIIYVSVLLCQGGGINKRHLGSNFFFQRLEGDLPTM